VPSEANCRPQKRQRVRHPVLKKRGGAADVACDDPADVLKTDTQLAGSRSAHKNLEESLDFFLRRRGDNDAADRQSSVVLLFAGPSFLS